MNLTNLAVSAAVANAVTTGMFQSNILDFFTGRMDGVYKAGADGSGRITLPEFFSGVNIHEKYAGGTLGGVLAHNFKKNGFMMIAQVVGIPIAAKMLTRVLRRPVLNPMNKLLKMGGIKDVKV